MKQRKTARYLKSIERHLSNPGIACELAYKARNMELTLRLNNVKHYLGIRIQDNSFDNEVMEIIEDVFKVNYKCLRTENNIEIKNDWEIKFKKYRKNGYTKETLQNDYSEIRQEEYKKIWVEEILEKKTL